MKHDIYDTYAAAAMQTLIKPDLFVLLNFGGKHSPAFVQQTMARVATAAFAMAEEMMKRRDHLPQESDAPS